VLSRYLDILATPGARAFAGWGLLARLQMGLTGLATFLLVQMQYGSYAWAGIVLAAIAVSYAIIAPQVARLIDAHGQATVLRWGFAIALAGRAAMLVAVAMELPLWALIAIAPTFAAGGSQSTLTRARWAHVLKDRTRLDSAFALESSLEEIIWILGPAVATVLAVSVAPWVPSVIAMLSLAVGGYVFLSLKDTEPPARRHTADAGLAEAALAVAPATAAAAIALPPVTGAAARPIRRRRPLSGHLLVTAPALAIAALIFLTQGAMFAAIDASVVAFAEDLGAKGAAGLILGLWAAGSLVGGLAYGVIAWRRTLATRLFWGVTATGLFAVALVFAPSLFVLGGLLFGMGLFIAPNMVIGDGLVHHSIPRARMTEGMTWTRTGIDLGMAIGAWTAGAAIDARGAGAGFAVTAAAGLAGLLVVASAWRFIRSRPSFEEAPAVVPIEHAPGHVVAVGRADARAGLATDVATGSFSAEPSESSRVPV